MKGCPAPVQSQEQTMPQVFPVYEEPMYQLARLKQEFEMNLLALNQLYTQLAQQLPQHMQYTPVGQQLPMNPMNSTMLGVPPLNQFQQPQVQSSMTPTQVGEQSAKMFFQAPLDHFEQFEVQSSMNPKELGEHLAEALPKEFRVCQGTKSKPVAEVLTMLVKEHMGNMTQLDLPELESLECRQEFVIEILSTWMANFYPEKYRYKPIAKHLKNVMTVLKNCLRLYLERHPLPDLTKKHEDGEQHPGEEFLRIVLTKTYSLKKGQKPNKKNVKDLEAQLFYSVYMIFEDVWLNDANFLKQIKYAKHQFRKYNELTKLLRILCEIDTKVGRTGYKVCLIPSKKPGMYVKWYFDDEDHFDILEEVFKKHKLPKAHIAVFKPKPITGAAKQKSIDNVDFTDLETHL
jgi:hypothetical protein